MSLFLPIVGAADNSDHRDSEDWWSLAPLSQPEIPVLDKEDSLWVRTPVDAFVIAKLRGQSLSPSAEADRKTLIRRLFFDLIGLPPSPAEIQRFIDDPDSKAYERLVDRLLNSPRYGERWARYWLDVVHYGDTHGYDKDKLRLNAWPYRDYVIRSFNSDKPYSRFVCEQIAGDVLYPGSAEGIIATGFIAAGPWDFVAQAEVPETKIDGKVARHLDRDDMVATTMNTFVSMTVQCAQCHDHKFDPVSQEDYYSLQAVFAALDRADRPYDLDLEVLSRQKALARRRNALAFRKSSLEKQISELGGTALAEIEKAIEASRKLEEGHAAESARLTEEKRTLLNRLVGTAVLDELDEVRNEWNRVNEKIEKLPKGKMVYSGTVHCGSGNFRGTGAEDGKPREIRLLYRGNVLTPGPVVGPGTLAVIKDLPSRFETCADGPEEERRKALAQWIVDPRNPLTWRSIANRIWLYHFGRGIADSPNDFGRMGQLPTHPELLDWLAAEFRDNGQSIKHLHRLMLKSATYRQASASDPDRAVMDSGNRYFGRMERKRLDAEAIRDSVLWVSGALDERMYGPGFQDFVIEKPEHSPHYEYHLYDPNDRRCHRRSIYRFLVRSQQQPFMTALDCADPSMQVDKRSETYTALQAMALMNDKFMIAMAERFAVHLGRTHRDLVDQVPAGFERVTGREPDEDESRALLGYARTHGLENVCRVLFNLNEFAFVD